MNNKATEIRKLQLVRFCIERDRELKMVGCYTYFNRPILSHMNGNITVFIKSKIRPFCYLQYIEKETDHPPCKCCPNLTCVFGQRYVGFVKDAVKTVLKL